MTNRYLLDTHTLLWWWLEPQHLSTQARQTIINPHNNIFISLINLWEIGIKYQKGKLPQAKPVINQFEQLADDDQFIILPTTLQHARTASLYPQKHADPFDRMLIAQAECEKLTLISKDEKFPTFNIPLLW